MLTILGTIGDKTFEKETPIAAKTVADRFPGLPLPTVAQPVYLEFADRHKGKDPDGKPLAPPSIAIPTVLTVQTVEGDSFTLKINTGKPGRDKNRVILNQVRTQLTFNDFEKALFLLLSKRCESNPFSRGVGRFDFKVVNPAAETQKVFQQQLKVNELQNEILQNLPWLSVQLRAAGLNIRGNNARSELKQGELATRARLIVLLNQFPTEFIQEWDKHQNELDGMLWTALDSGLIVRGEENGRKVLKFSQAMGGRRILYLQGGNEYDQLKNATLIDTDVMVAIRKYYDGLAKESAPVEKAATAPVRPNIDERRAQDLEIIAEAKALNILSYDPENGSVNLRNAKDIESSLVILDIEMLTEANGYWDHALATVFANDKNKRQAVAISLAHRKKKLE